MGKKYVVTHWNIATKSTEELFANSPREAVIKAGYSNESSLENCESRSINSDWETDEDKYYAGIREIYAIEYQCEHDKLPKYFYEMFDDKNYGVYSFKIFKSKEKFNFYDAKVDSESKFIHPHIVGRLLNKNEVKSEYCENKALEVFCNNESILKLP